jgi:hypothetical protein
MNQTLWSNDGNNRRPTVIEIEQAHDILCDMLDDPSMKENAPADVQMAILISRDVLCYVLGHEENAAFAENLQQWSKAFFADLGGEERYDN